MALRPRILLAALPLLSACENPRYCDETTACADPAEVCDRPRRTCVSGATGLDLAPPPDLATPPCSGPMDCPAATPTCAMGACVACGPAGPSLDCRGRDPTTPLCGAAGTCVECLAPGDCEARQMTCDQERCAPCRRDADCTTGYCDLDAGLCARPGEVFLVDNRGSAPATCKAGHANADGKTAATAFCDVADALPPKPTRPYVLVRGSRVPYGAIVLTSTAAGVRVAVAGPGRTADPPATISQSGVAAVAINATTGGSATVSLRGLDLIGSAGAVKADAVSCTATSGSLTLTITRSALRDSGKAGLYTASCQATLDGNAIFGNAGGGLWLGGASRYAVTNNWIVDNGLGGRGVTISDASSGTFAFNTVAGNHYGTLVSGISCGKLLAKPILGSIVWGNGPVGLEQLTGNCDVTEVVVGMGTADLAPARKLDPQFVNVAMPQSTAPLLPPYDYHLVGMSAKNQQCCVDKLDAAADRPQHDADGDPRPRAPGGKLDVGAHEVE